MSFNFIHDFQIKLHQQLSADEFIRLSVDRIYLSVVQDAKYPFLLINILKVQDLSKFAYFIYDVEFEICAFARDKNQGVLTSIADKILLKLQPESCHFQGYVVAGIKAGVISFQRGHDILTNKLVMPYRASLKKEA